MAAVPCTIIGGALSLRSRPGAAGSPSPPDTHPNEALTTFINDQNEYKGPLTIAL